MVTFEKIDSFLESTTDWENNISSIELNKDAFELLLADRVTNKPEINIKEFVYNSKFGKILIKKEI